jgi:hypothetical protein
MLIKLITTKVWWDSGQKCSKYTAFGYFSQEFLAESNKSPFKSYIFLISLSNNYCFTILGAQIVSPLFSTKLKLTITFLLESPIIVSWNFRHQQKRPSSTHHSNVGNADGSTHRWQSDQLEHRPNRTRDTHTHTHICLKVCQRVTKIVGEGRRCKSPTLASSQGGSQRSLHPDGHAFVEPFPHCLWWSTRT